MNALKKVMCALTMGGEPTFVSIDDYEGDEWNTGAVGPTKTCLLQKISFAACVTALHPADCCISGQGKWYPGEQLPRWAFALYWRADEEPLWEDPNLIDSETPKAAADHKVAKRFIYKLSEKLRIDPQCVIPAYEDPAHFALVEQKLPFDVDPKNNKIEDPAERARIVKVFEQGLSNPAGFVLPVQGMEFRSLWTLLDVGSLETAP